MLGQILSRSYRVLGFRIDAAGLVFHTIPVAILASILRPELIIAIALLYIAYQIIDYLAGESAEEVQGDFVEFIFGLAIADLVMWIA